MLPLASSALPTSCTSSCLFFLLSLLCHFRPVFGQTDKACLLKIIFVILNFKKVSMVFWQVSRHQSFKNTSSSSASSSVRAQMMIFSWWIMDQKHNTRTHTKHVCAKRNRSLSLSSTKYITKCIKMSATTSLQITIVIIVIDVTVILPCKIYIFEIFSGLKIRCNFVPRFYTIAIKSIFAQNV